MNRFFSIFLSFLLLPAVGFAAGCASAKSPTQAALLHRRFVLESIDGIPFASATRTPDIEFNEGFRVSGQICNRYMG